MTTLKMEPGGYWPVIAKFTVDPLGPLATASTSPVETWMTTIALVRSVRSSADSAAPCNRGSSVVWTGCPSTAGIENSSCALALLDHRRGGDQAGPGGGGRRIGTPLESPTPGSRADRRAPGCRWLADRTSPRSHRGGRSPGNASMTSAVTSPERPSRARARSGSADTGRVAVSNTVPGSGKISSRTAS